MKLNHLLLFLALIIIFTGSNVLFIYWNEEFQWYIIILSSSVVAAFIDDFMKLKFKVAMWVLAWVISVFSTTFVLCYPLILWEGGFMANEIIISVVARTLTIMLIGLIISLTSLMFFSLLSGWLF